jgi:hypothetical protein
MFDSQQIGTVTKCCYDYEAKTPQQNNNLNHHFHSTTPLALNQMPPRNKGKGAKQQPKEDASSPESGIGHSTSPTSNPAISDEEILLQNNKPQSVS